MKKQVIERDGDILSIITSYTIILRGRFRDLFTKWSEEDRGLLIDKVDLVIEKYLTFIDIMTICCL